MGIFSPMAEANKPAQLVPIMSHADYAVQSEKRSTLRAKRAMYQQELRDVEARIVSLSIDDEAEIARLAVAFAAESTFEPAQSLAVLSGEAARLRTIIAALQRVDTEQRLALAESRADLSIDAAAAVMPAHKAAIAKMLAGFEMIEAAIVDERAARAQLTDAGYDQRLWDGVPPVRIDVQNNLMHAGWFNTAKSYVK